MSKVMVNESSLSAIGAAIRGKNGTTNTYKPSEMAAAISSIPAGGGNFDFSNLEYVQLTSSGSSSSGNSELPDLTPFISDFNKVVCIMNQTTNEAYIYLRGTDTNRSIYKDMFYYGRYSYSTPSNSLSGGPSCFGLDVTNLKKPGIMYISSPSQGSPLSEPWKGGFIMYYEGG